MRVPLFLLLTSCGSAMAQAPGTLDPSFDGDGLWSDAPDQRALSFSDVLPTADGTMLLAGNIHVHNTSDLGDFFAARMLGEGGFDPSFSSDGFDALNTSITSDWSAEVVQMDDGRIVVCGSKSFGGLVLVRYLPDGQPDLTFGINGVVQHVFTGLVSNQHLRNVVVQPDHKVLVSGYFGNTPNLVGISRFTESGDIDPLFNNGQPVLLEGGVSTGLVLQPDGKLITSIGTSSTPGHFTIARLLANGELDADFGVGGYATTVIDGGGFAYATDLALQSTGSIVVLGTSNDTEPPYGRRIAMARFTSSGALDLSFGNAGTVITDLAPTSAQGLALALEANDAIVVGSNPDFVAPQRFIVLRYEANGEQDLDFGAGGLAECSFYATTEPGTTVLNSVAVQPDGRILAAGSYRTTPNAKARPAVARFFGADGATGLENTPTTAASVFVNAASGELHWQSTEPLASNAQFVLFDVRGKQIGATGTMAQGASAYSMPIPRHLPGGVYILRVQHSRHRAAYRVLIQH
jgi:uncharacterized delta-60 repeat protein